MDTKTQHANPLTFWVPVRQGFLFQWAVRVVLRKVKGGLSESDPGHFLHFVRFAGIPNPLGKGIMGLLLLTDFDKPMTPYLNYFFHYVPLLRHAFALLYFIAKKPPRFPETRSIFEQYLTAYNLGPADAISFAHNATVAQVLAAFPPAATGTNANPFTLWIPVKQDPASQAMLAQLLAAQKGGLITDGAHLIHYSRTVGIPNPAGGILGILIATEFDGPADAFVDYFYTRPDIRDLFAAMFKIATDPPQLPDNAGSFKQFVGTHALATTAMLYAYRATVAEIIKKFPPAP